ncbi:MAG TPA: tannase/feruloyl esterase family alpha/beta hydrolase [Burkholderiales bacterium]|nr:tannase/feruloyl esterase family alpha/beta hydrolase [Burkholderiales bacterium]
MLRFELNHMLLAAAAAIAAPAAAAIPCADLVNLKIAPGDIGLPSGGATIAFAAMATVPADAAKPDVKRDYCKVLGAVQPVDPAAPPVNFQVNLPVQWNGKAVQYGGGGSNGVLITGLNPLRDARADSPVPVARGFATWGTDAGHDNRKLAEPREFALNDEALANMAYAAYKKTRDAGVKIATAFYGRAPAKMYFFGGSEGGREALLMAQRYPHDFDGVVSVVPVVNYTGANLMRARLGQIQRDGGWINPAKVKLIHDAVVAACDKLDGLADGVIGAYEKCLTVFDVRTLRCPNGADTGDTCLSDAQIEADRLAHRPFEYPFPMKHGVASFPGWNYGGEDQPGGLVDTITGKEKPEFPIKSAKTQSIGWNNADGFVRYMFVRDPKFNSLEFKPADHAARVRAISEMFDTTDPDLSAFLARGGKLILKGNGADYQRSVMQEIVYYQSVVARMGQERVNRFVRFFVTPGVNHAGNGLLSSGAAVPAKVDLLGALDSWIDTGKAPEQLTQVTQEGQAPFKVTASRPMCPYPLTPRYDGRGDPNEASSFACADQ